MEITDIASMSIAMHQQQAADSCGIAVARKALDTQEQQGAQLVEALQQLPAPSTHQLDIRI
jgi:hypothetical protein